MLFYKLYSLLYFYKLENTQNVDLHPGSLFYPNRVQNYLLILAKHYITFIVTNVTLHLLWQTLGQLQLKLCTFASVVKEILSTIDIMAELSKWQLFLQ